MSVEVPVPAGFNAIASLPKQRENLINCFNPGDNSIISTPGLTLFTQGLGFARGITQFKREVYMASGTRFIKVPENGTIVNIGQLVGTDRVEFAASFTQIVIVNTQTGDGFTSDGSTMAAIGGSYASSVDVAAIGGRAVFCPTDGGPVFYSLTNDFSTIDGFVDAEFLPDVNLGVITYKNKLYVLGEDSIQKFGLSPDPDLPLVPASGSEIQTGYVAARILYAKTFVFLGKNRNQGYGFFALGSGEAQEISNPAVSELLQNYTLEELQGCQSHTYTWLGYEIVEFTVTAIEPDSINRTFAFINGAWFFTESGINGAGVQNSHRAAYINFAYGKYIIGDRTNPNIGTFTADSEEYGGQIEREIATFARSNRGSWFEIPSLTVDAYSGSPNLTNPNNEPTMGLETSDNGVDYGPQIWAGLGFEADYDRRTEFEGPGGLGRYENFAGLRFRTTEAIIFGVDGIQLGDK